MNSTSKILLGCTLTLTGIALGALAEFDLVERIEIVQQHRRDLGQRLSDQEPILTSAPAIRSNSPRSGVWDRPVLQQAVSNSLLKNTSLKIGADEQQQSRATFRTTSSYSEIKKLLSDLHADQPHVCVVAVKLVGGGPASTEVSSEIVLQAQP